MVLYSQVFYKTLAKGVQDAQERLENACRAARILCNRDAACEMQAFSCSACSSSQCTISRTESSLCCDLGLDTDASLVPHFYRALLRHCAEHGTDGATRLGDVADVAWGRVDASRGHVVNASLPRVQRKNIRWTVRRLLASRELVPVEDAEGAYNNALRRTAVNDATGAPSEASLLQNLASLFSSLSVVGSTVGAVVGAVLGVDREPPLPSGGEEEEGGQEDKQETLLGELWDEWAGQALAAVRSQCGRAVDSHGILPLLELQPTGTQEVVGIADGPLSLPYVLHAAGGSVRTRFTTQGMPAHSAPSLSRAGELLVQWLCYRGWCVGIVEAAHGVGRVLLLQLKVQQAQGVLLAVGSPGKAAASTTLSPQAAQLCAAPLLLRERCACLEARQRQAEGRAEGHRGKAKVHSAAGRREQAIAELKLWKLYELQASKAGNQLHTATAALHAYESARASAAQASVLEAASAAMLQVVQSMPDVDAVLEDLQESIDRSAEVSQSLSSPLGTGGLMESEVEAELRAMEVAGAQQQGAALPALPTHTHTASPGKAAAAPAVPAATGKVALPA